MTRAYTSIDRPDEVRVSKVAQVREMGLHPYPNDFRPSATIDEVAGPLRRWKAEVEARGAEAWVAERDAYNDRADKESVAVCGRVMSRRDFGKGVFLTIQDGTGRIQLLAGKRNLPAESSEEAGLGFKFLKKVLDIGDFVGVRGHLFFTRTGELTVQVEQARLLTKSLRPLPEKWHGLQDLEARYRQRYVDLIVNPTAREVFRRRAATIQTIRRFLDGHGFLEVETPMLHPVAGGAAARPFVTHHNALDMPLYLRIAPELYLKRLVVGGFERVYEVNRSFRNEGLSRRHNPEFTMLEFYWAYATHRDLMPLTEQMIGEVVQGVCGSLTITYQGETIDFSPPWRTLDLRQAVVDVGGLPSESLNDPEALRRVLEPTEVVLTGRETLGKLQTLVFEELVEPRLIQPTFVTGFPVDVSPLARRSDDDPSTVDRFELFVAGREIANAFSELNDPEDQRERFIAQLEARAAGDEEALPYDADYIRALQYGMPPTAGEGIGIDRLVMLLVDAPSIRDVILFPHMRREAE